MTIRPKLKFVIFIILDLRPFNKNYVVVGLTFRMKFNKIVNCKQNKKKDKIGEEGRRNENARGVTQ